MYVRVLSLPDAAQIQFVEIETSRSLNSEVLLGSDSDAVLVLEIDRVVFAVNLMVLVLGLLEGVLLDVDN